MCTQYRPAFSMRQSRMNDHAGAGFVLVCVVQRMDCDMRLANYATRLTITSELTGVILAHLVSHLPMRGSGTSIPPCAHPTAWH